MIPQIMVRISGAVLIAVGGTPFVIGGILFVDGFIPKSKMLKPVFGMNEESWVGLIMIITGAAFVKIGVLLLRKVRFR